MLTQLLVTASVLSRCDPASIDGNVAAVPDRGEQVEALALPTNGSWQHIRANGGDGCASVKCPLREVESAAYAPSSSSIFLWLKMSPVFRGKHTDSAPRCDVHPLHATASPLDRPRDSHASEPLTRKRLPASRGGRTDWLIPITAAATVLLTGACSVAFEERARKLLQPTDIVGFKQTSTTAGPSAGDQVGREFPLVDLGPFLTNAETPLSQEQVLRLQERLLIASDRACLDFKTGVYARTASRRVFFAEGALLSAGAAAIVPSEVATRVLAGTAAAFTGTSAIIDAEVWQNQLSTALFRQIDADRREVLSQITARRADETPPYNSLEPIRDALRYHERCSFTSAIANLSNSAGTPSLSRSVIDQDIVRQDDRISKLQDQVSNLQGQQNSGQRAELERELLVARNDRIRLEFLRSLAR